MSMLPKPIREFTREDVTVLLWFAACVATLFGLWLFRAMAARGGV